MIFLAQEGFEAWIGSLWIIKFEENKYFEFYNLNVGYQRIPHCCTILPP